MTLKEFLEVQLLIESAGQKRLATMQMDVYSEGKRSLIALQDAKCEEIKKQIKLLEK